LTRITTNGNGTSDVILNLSRALTADDILLPVMIATPGIGDGLAPAQNPILNPVGHRISDLGLGPLSNGLFEPVWAHDQTIAGTSTAGIGMIQVGGFDGSKWLRAHQNITIEGHLLTSTYVTSSTATSLFYDTNVPTTLRTSSGLWLPSFSDNTSALGGFSGLVPTASTGDSSAMPGVTQTSVPATNLRDFQIPGTDPRLVNNAILDFLFQVPTSTAGLLYTARVVNPTAPDWYNHITPWTLDLHDIITQRGGATILNNVIHPENGELATLQYNQPSSGPVTITVFTLSGSIVNVLTRVQSQAAGDYAVSWDGKNRGGRIVARGIYFIRIVAPGIDEIRKVLVVR
jgi:hypothetical protein